MAIFKCKMCGGTLEVGNESVAVCEYCGTQQTLPKLDDEKKANLYDRANHFRRNNEYDKAKGIYERILNEDNTDAEAYWSIVLCHYGIEYVEDPTTRKRVPTVNRAQFTSIFDDANYKAALSYADGLQKRIYEEEAKNINEIQKGILTISQKEEPFDVFICYKETDNAGRRTPDSVLANDLYHQLTQEGFKVFFSRITLEDKLGSAYEPYIFAALNSAKVMVVLGTKPEYYNAVWVKNEWSRYLSLIKSGATKILIPAYKDMDPYDLPDEFSHLQAQDMSKLGFMQDLIRGIKKIIDTQSPKATVIKETVVTGGNTNVTPLLKRAFMFLEDKEWKSADEYCEKVLDIDPECAEAYLGKLMTKLRVSKREGLKEQLKPFENDPDYKKVMRFADDDLKSELKSYIDFVINRNLTTAYNEAVSLMEQAAKNDEQAYKLAAEKFSKISNFKDSKKKAEECIALATEAKLYDQYFTAIGKMNRATTEREFEHASSLFENIRTYRDAEHMSQLCLEKAEECRKDSIYAAAVSWMERGETTYTFYQAIQYFKSIDPWKDSKDKIAECEKAIHVLEEKSETLRIEKERLDEEKRLADAKAAKKRKTIITITIFSVCVCIAFVILLIKVIIPNGKYNDAIALMDEGKIDEARVIFNELGDYKDSSNKLNDIRNLMTKEQLQSIKNGDYVKYIKFGAYEQDNNTSNGKEDIEWLVLEVNDGKVLVISKYALDCQEYNTICADVTWETCTLRQWLNNDFINAAFSADDKEMIPTVTVSADKNPFYSANPGNATQDQVFLLSAMEASKYFFSSGSRVCKPTDYTVATGIDLNIKTGFCGWWLRSPGEDQQFAAGVYSTGAMFKCCNYVDYDNFAVRPALWIDLNY